MKRIAHYFILTLLTFSAQVYAVAPGLYLGLMAGPATNQGSVQYVQLQGSSATAQATPSSTQFGTRGFVGYKFNQYAAVEGGVSYYSSINYTMKSGTACSNVTARLTNGDLVGVGMFPVGSFFDLYAKAGAALTLLSTSAALNPQSGNECGNTYNQVRFRGTVSAGASYDLSQNWVADVSWNRVMIRGILTNVDLYAVGIAYHFVDKYCGQFLCDE